MAIQRRTFTRTAFFDTIIGRLRSELPEPLRSFQLVRYSFLIKIHYGNERVHFEVWVDTNRNQIEIGLDFEDGAESTAAYLQFFDRHIVEIKQSTGPTLELERWTKTWGHLVEVYPIEPFTPDRAHQIADRMIVIISTLQPFVEEAGIAPGRHATHHTRRFWTRRRR